MKGKNNSINDIMNLDENMVKLSDVNYVSNDIKSIFQYEEEYNDNLYSDIFMALTHKHFAEDDAKELWKRVLMHRIALEEKLHRDPGIVVSCLDYLTNIENILTEATIIEEGKSQYLVTTNLKDQLTNLFIRAVFDIILIKEFTLSKRNELPLSMMMIDIDNFKQVNDKYGHVAGDKVLAKIGEIINVLIRSMDIACRYGGEEITVIMPNTDEVFGNKIGERIRSEISKTNFGDFGVTVSVGVAQYEQEDETPIDLLLKADKALYSAKEIGKNRVVSYSESLSYKKDE